MSCPGQFHFWGFDYPRMAPRPPGLQKAVGRQELETRPFVRSAGGGQWQADSPGFEDRSGVTPRFLEKRVKVLYS